MDAKLGVAGCEEYHASKTRIDAAISQLRADLLQMQEQDQALLRQLLHIHYTLATLSGKRTKQRLSCSSTEDARSDRSSTDSCGSSLGLERKTSFWTRRQSEPADRLLSASQDDVTHLGSSDVTWDHVDGADDSEQENNVFSSSLTTSDFKTMTNNQVNSREDYDTLSPLRSTFIRQTSLRGNNHGLANKNHPNSYHNGHVARKSRSVTPGDENANKPRYEIAYGQLLRSGSKLWKDVQHEMQESGTIDDKKRTALQIIF